MLNFADFSFSRNLPEPKGSTQNITVTADFKPFYVYEIDSPKNKKLPNLQINESS
jgi:hypothetical protein